MTSDSEQTNDSVEPKLRLAEIRYRTIAKLIEALNVHEVVDMGVGEGKLLEILVQSAHISNVMACEPTKSGLRDMHYKLARWEEANRLRVKPDIFQSSLFYRDNCLVNRGCMVLCEVIEHVEHDRIDSSRPFTSTKETVHEQENAKCHSQICLVCGKRRTISQTTEYRPSS